MGRQLGLSTLDQLNCVSGIPPCWMENPDPSFLGPLREWRKSVDVSHERLARFDSNGRKHLHQGLVARAHRLRAERPIRP